jgi:hypothetical protein
MKIQSLAPLLVACMTLLPAAHAQLPKLEQKTAFCATSAELFGKRDSSDMYLCQTSKYTCGPYLKPTCLDEAKEGGWEVASGTKKTLVKDYANTPCNCVGTQYELTRKLVEAAPVAVAPAALAPTPAATSATSPISPPLAAAPAPVANAAAPSLAREVEGLKQDNVQIKRQLDLLQRQLDELRRNLPAAK